MKGMLESMPFYFWVNSMSVAQLQSRHLILFGLDGALVGSAADLYRAMNLSLEKLEFPMVTEEQVRAWWVRARQNYVRPYLNIYLGR